VIALAFVAATASDSWGQSKQPSPSRTKPDGQAQTQSNPVKQEPAADRRGTDQFPLSVKIVGAEPKAQDPAPSGTKENDKQPTDWWMFGATVALAAIAILQLIAFIAQARYMKRTVVEMRRTTSATIQAASATRTAAVAALRQANAMIAIESPIFAVQKLDLVGYENEQATVSNIDSVPPGLPPPFCKPLILLQNRGRTEMTVNRVFCDWIVGPTVEETPDYHFEEIWNGALVKESSFPFVSQNGIRLSQEQIRTIDDYGAFLWVYGKIIYTDFMGERFEHGYIARWTKGKGFVRDPLANYEYKRKI
jgi:hypothetical protein